MSADGNFLARWSRRKGEAADAPPAASREAGPVADQPGAENEAAAPTPEGALTPEGLPCEPSSLPALDLTKLPPIDAITAATDIRPFLAAGVPEELKHAALRRAWLADPAIRDFVGIAENQWDFTTPGGAPGFGPLSSADDIGKLLAQVFGDEPDESAQPVSGDVPRRSSQPVTEPDESVHAPAADQAAQADLKAALDGPAEATPEASVILQKTRAYIAVQNKTGPNDEKDQSSKRSHGGALPK